MAGQHEVQLYVTVPEEEIVYVGMRLQVLLGKENEVLFVLSLIRQLLSVGAFQP